MLTNSHYSINYEYRDVLLRSFCNAGDIISYRKDSLIEFEYKTLDYVYLITEGTVKQFFTNINGIEKTILILSKGDMFGEITMFQKDHDHCITKTYTDAKVCKISKDTFYDYLNKNPALYDSILVMLSTKIRLLMYQIYDSNYLDTKEKLYCLLKRLSIQYGTKKEKGSEIDLYLTHEEISSMIGSTRSTVTKLMNLLEDEGKIKRNGKKILIYFESD